MYTTNQKCVRVYIYIHTHTHTHIHTCLLKTKNNRKQELIHWVWWCIPVISALNGERQENCEFKVPMRDGSGSKGVFSANFCFAYVKPSVEQS